ncbi:hypothetical protein B0H13DRAFT_1915979 [Mycena leptocephala]|nr:hypothetical protein B0H13DRAFT_1915979 [Mycena leptocephala]
MSSGSKHTPRDRGFLDGPPTGQLIGFRSYNSFISCSGWTPESQTKHQIPPIPDHVHENLLAQLFAGQPLTGLADGDEKDTKPHISLRQSHCPHAHIKNRRELTSARSRHPSLRNRDSEEESEHAKKRAKTSENVLGPRIGKEARIAARQTRNLRKATKNNSKMPRPPPSPPPSRADVTSAPLDPKIVQWCVFPLPDDEELFLDALDGSQGRDFTCLELWMVEPLFADDDDDMDPQNLQYITFTNNMRIALHGLRLRQEQADNTRRRAAFAAAGVHGEAARQEELRELQARWTRVMALPAYPVTSRKYAMWIHYANWLARTIHRLYHLEFLN